MGVGGGCGGLTAGYLPQNRMSSPCGLGDGGFRLDGVERMRERPIQDLPDGLRQLGANVRSERDNGCPPVILQADGLPGGRTVVRGEK